MSTTLCSPRLRGVLFLSAGLLFASCTRTSLPAPPAAPRTPSIQVSGLGAEIQRLALLAGGQVGVGAVHLESGRSYFLEPDVAFPMASSYKVPIAVQLLHRVEEGEVTLDTMLRIKPSDLHPGSGTLSSLFDDPGVALSLHNLLELMLLISDNSATDLVLKSAGGARAVSARMRDLGIEGLRVDRPTIELIADFVGVLELPPEDELSLQSYREVAGEVSAAGRRAAAAAFDADRRDTSTPEAMTRLLEQIWRGEALGEENTELLIGIMRRCQTGENRIKGMLPPDTVVAHKTGTIGGTTNDVGVITLPDDAGHVVIVVFVKESDLPVSERERAIAHISRAIYDFFLFAEATVQN